MKIMIITLPLTDKHCEISVERESVAFTIYCAYFNHRFVIIWVNKAIKKLLKM